MKAKRIVLEEHMVELRPMEVLQQFRMDLVVRLLLQHLHLYQTVQEVLEF